MPAAPLEVVAAVIADGGRYLACRRRPDRSAAGRWEFPGGKVEAGETPADALVREIDEELGVPVEVGEPLCTSETVVGGRAIRLVCLRARLRAERPTTSTDHDRLAWLSPIELPQLHWAEPDLPAVRLLAREGAPEPTASPRDSLEPWT